MKKTGIVFSWFSIFIFIPICVFPQNDSWNKKTISDVEDGAKLMMEAFDMVIDNYEPYASKCSDCAAVIREVKKWKKNPESIPSDNTRFQNLVKRCEACKKKNESNSNASGTSNNNNAKSIQQQKQEQMEAAEQIIDNFSHTSKNIKADKQSMLKQIKSLELDDNFLNNNFNLDENEYQSDMEDIANDLFGEDDNEDDEFPNSEEDTINDIFSGDSQDSPYLVQVNDSQYMYKTPGHPLGYAGVELNNVDQSPVSNRPENNNTFEIIEPGEKSSGGEPDNPNESPLENEMQSENDVQSDFSNDLLSDDIFPEADSEENQQNIDDYYDNITENQNQEGNNQNRQDDMGKSILNSYGVNDKNKQEVLGFANEIIDDSKPIFKETGKLVPSIGSDLDALNIKDKAIDYTSSITGIPGNVINRGSKIYNASTKFISNNLDVLDEAIDMYDFTNGDEVSKFIDQSLNKNTNTFFKDLLF